MDKEIILTRRAPSPIGPYSQAVKVDHFLFLSGQIPVNPETNEVITGTIEEQTKRVLNNIEAVLQAAGYGLDNVVKVTVFLKDISLFTRFNKVYEKYFRENPPARTTVEVSNLPKGVLLEIDAIAYK